jgi:plastocyanin
MAAAMVRSGPAMHGTLAGWRGLTAFGCALAVAIVVAVNVSAGTPILPLIAFGVGFTAGGLLLALRPGRAGAVIALLAAAMFLAPGVPRAVEAFAWANDPLEFTVQVAGLVALFGVSLGGLVVIVRGQRTLTTRSTAPRGLILLSLGIVVAALLASFALRFTVQDAAAAPGDVVVDVRRAAFPASITASSGSFDILVANADAGAHTFTVDALGVDLVAPGRSRTKVSVTADPGQYEVYCRIPGHDFMTSTLLVQ